jgi:hypothetical protein
MAFPANISTALNTLYDQITAEAFGSLSARVQVAGTSYKVRIVWLRQDGKLKITATVEQR